MTWCPWSGLLQTGYYNGGTIRFTVRDTIRGTIRIFTRVAIRVATRTGRRATRRVSIGIVADGADCHSLASPASRCMAPVFSCASGT